MVKWKIATLLGALLVPATLFAHASLIKSAPAQRAVLLRAPAKIQLWFNERLEPRYSTFTVSDASGKTIDIGAAQVSPDDPKLISVSLKALPAGRYLVKYRVLSVDGHVSEDRFSFIIKQ